MADPKATGTPLYTPLNTLDITQKALRLPHPPHLSTRLPPTLQVAEEQEREAARRAQEEELARKAAEAAREEAARAEAALKVQTLARPTCFRFAARGTILREFT